MTCEEYHGCFRSRDWEILDVTETEGGELQIYAQCGNCGQVKSSLVDFTRNYANCMPVTDRGQYDD